MLGSTLAVILALAVALSLVVVVRSVRWHHSHVKHEAGYLTLQVGDSKQKVVELLGPPDELENCHDPAGTEMARKCRKQYNYFGFFERWSYCTDQDERVIAKYYSASF